MWHHDVRDFSAYMAMRKTENFPKGSQTQLVVFEPYASEEEAFTRAETIVSCSPMSVIHPRANMANHRGKTADLQDDRHLQRFHLQW